MANPVIWGLPIRIIHWVVAGGIVLNRFVLEAGDPPHRWLGYAVVALVLLRVLWGMIARAGAVSFRSWPLRMFDLKSFFGNHFSRVKHNYPAHNPAASYIYLAMWALMISMGVTGWMMGLDAFWGEEWLESIHGTMANVIIGLVVLHLVGILLDAYLFKRRSWMVMITGKRSD